MGLPEWTALISPQKAPPILGTPCCLRLGSPHPPFRWSRAELTFDTQPATRAVGAEGIGFHSHGAGGCVGGGGGGVLPTDRAPPFPGPPPI